MLRRGPGKTGKKLFLSVAMLSLGALFVGACAYRTPLQEAWERLRIRGKPGHVFDLLDREPGSPGGKAARWFVKTDGGRELMFRAFLEKQIPAKTTSYLKTATRVWDTLIFWTGADGLDHMQLTRQGRPRHIKWASPPVEHSRSVGFLLGEAGAEGLTTPEYPGLTFSFVKPDRWLEDLYDPGPRFLVVPTGMAFKVLEDEDAPPFVCLVLKADADYPRLLPGPFR